MGQFSDPFEEKVAWYADILLVCKRQVIDKAHIIDLADVGAVRIGNAKEVRLSWWTVALSLLDV